MKRPPQIEKPQGKLGVLLPGLGAVSTTFIAGCLLARRGFKKPIGSITQMGTIRLGKRTENRTPAINGFVPLAQLDDLVFGAWDLFEEIRTRARFTPRCSSKKTSIPCAKRCP